MHRLIVLLLACVVACSGAADAPPDVIAGADSTPWRQPGDVVDSIFPMEEQLRRFRDELPRVTALAGGARTREALVAGFMKAIEQRDTLYLRDALMSRAEFAWIYFPEHHFSKPPYEIPPGFFWFQTQQASEKGVGRVLERFGGQPLNYQSHICPPEEMKPFGRGTIHPACKVVYDRPTMGRDTLALFSGIFELNGRFKFVSYSNDF